MKKDLQLYIVRGHSGSGKSTFAKSLLADKPIELSLHLENDMFLYNEQGEYVWSPALISEATKKFKKELNDAINNRVPYIAISNKFIKANDVIQITQFAKKRGYNVTVYKMSNFYPNLHGVTERQILQDYFSLKNNVVEGEIDVEPEYVSQEMADKIQKIEQFKQSPNFELDVSTQSKISKEYLEIGMLLGDFIVKPSEKYPNLRVLKYRSTTFFNNTWNDALLEMRGLIIDKENNFVVRPFDKLFNYSERVDKNAYLPLVMPDSEKVLAITKINGFLGVATYVSSMNEVLYSTTGSLDSSFAKLTQKHLTQYEKLFKSFPDHSFMFEICDESDPHIITEELGAYLIGVREVKTGKMFTIKQLDELAIQYNILHPTHFVTTFGELKALLKDCKHEGFMVYSLERDEKFKMKSPYYLVSKFLGRSKIENLDEKLNKQNSAEEFYPLIDYIKDNKNHFNQLNEQQKIKFIQDFLESF